MDGRPDERSQPLLRVPRDKTPAELTLDDGEQSYVLLYIAPGDRVARIFEEQRPFVPVTNGNGTRFIARTAIACITSHESRAALDHVVCDEWQKVSVKLRGGVVVRGELRWAAMYGSRRTIDHLNDDLPYLMIHEGDYVHHVAKSAVLAMEEI